MKLRLRSNPAKNCRQAHPSMSAFPSLPLEFCMQHHADRVRSIFWIHSLQRLTGAPSGKKLPTFATDAVELAMLTGSLFARA